MTTTADVLDHLFTVEAYHQMVDAGILTENDRVELINGRILTMSPIGRKHFACVNRLTNLFASRLVGQTIVSTQNPVVLDDLSEPEPDVVLLNPRADFYESELPTAADVLLLVEVSDATLRFDKQVKLPLYAESGIVEVWIADVKTGRIEVYTQPEAGSYTRQQTYKRGQTLSPQHFPALTVAVEEVIGLPER
jgi:Uma2 family endonuclease